MCEYDYWVCYELGCGAFLNINPIRSSWCLRNQAAVAANNGNYVQCPLVGQHNTIRAAGPPPSYCPAHQAERITKNGIGGIGRYWLMWRCSDWIAITPDKIGLMVVRLVRLEEHVVEEEQADSRGLLDGRLELRPEVGIWRRRSRRLFGRGDGL
jgi:hypothetical protein